MAYLDAFLTKTPAELIAAQAAQFESDLRHAINTFTSRVTTRSQAKANQARVTAAVTELRRIWRLANTGDDTWRPALLALAEEHQQHSRSSYVRFRLIANQAGHPAVTQEATP